LSSQRLDLRDALYNAEKKKPQVENANPLVESGGKLIPSVTRVFSLRSKLFVYLQAYRQDAVAGQLLLAYVSLYRGTNRVLETSPAKTTGAADNRLHTARLQFSVPLGSLQPGQYQCQVTVLDPVKQKAAFWQAPVVLVR
jgi:hypothetical protein